MTRTLSTRQRWQQLDHHAGTLTDLDPITDRQSIVHGDPTGGDDVVVLAQLVLIANSDRQAHTLPERRSRRFADGRRKAWAVGACSTQAGKLSAEACARLEVV